MEIVCIHDHDIARDGRSLSLLSRFSSAYEVRTLIPKKNVLQFLHFLKEIICLNFRAHEEVHVCFLTRKSLIFMIFLPLAVFRLKLTYDMRELYLISEQKRVKSQIGTICESVILRLANNILVANRQRARIVKKIYHLQKLPLVFENRRSLPKSLERDFGALRCQINHRTCQVNTKRFNLIITNGFSNERNDLRLVDAIREFPDATLTFIGKSSQAELNMLTGYCERYDITNIYHFAPLAFSFLRNFVQMYDVGVVNYSEQNRNNKYCASGKIFEFLDAGLPVITSDNRTLSDVVSRYGVGISGKNFAPLIEEIMKNREKYLTNVKNFNTVQEIENYQKNLVRFMNL